MENLYLILRKKSDHTSYDLLAKSAKSKNVEVKPIYTEDFDFSKKLKLTKKDALYKISTDTKSRLIEKFLINDKVNTFHKNYLLCASGLDNVIGYSLIHEKFNLPIIKTIFSITDDSNLLKKYVKSLNGFPIIIKSTGGMHGVGVIKIDSFESLKSVVDYLMSKNEQFIMRQFVKHKKQGRLIVLGDKVIASHQNIAALGFRTNMGSNELRQRKVVNYDDSIKEMAVVAVKTLDYEFGGVDILFEETTNKAYIAEVNSPCFFPTTQRLTGVNISEMMVNYLIEKSKNS